MKSGKSKRYSKEEEPLGLVTYTVEKAGLNPLFNLYKILNEITVVHLIMTKDIQIHNMEFDSFEEISHYGGGNPVLRIINIFKTQIKICLAISKLKNVQTLIFFMGGETLILPMIYSKIRRKKVILALGASQRMMSNLNKDFFRFFSFLCEINFYLADDIIVYSQTLIKEWELEKYKDKISLASHHNLDPDKFSMTKQINKRENIVGYVGRLSPEKGVLKLIKSIPLILMEEKDIKFTIIGDGKLMPKIEEYSATNDIGENLNLEGWVIHDKLGRYLNEFKVLVLPSYTEGLPGIMLEAMACGTPVLITEVGSVPDIIEDKVNGFLLKDNSVNSIKNGIIEAVNYPNLDRISENEMQTTKKFTLEEAILKYKKILYQ